MCSLHMNDSWEKLNKHLDHSLFPIYTNYDGWITKRRKETNSGIDASVTHC